MPKHGKGVLHVAYMPSLWSAILDLVQILGVHPVRPTRPGTRSGVRAHHSSVRHSRERRVVPTTPTATPMKCAACQAWRRRLWHCVVCGAALCGCCSFNSRGGRVCCCPGEGRSHFYRKTSVKEINRLFLPPRHRGETGLLRICPHQTSRASPAREATEGNRRVVCPLAH